MLKVLEPEAEDNAETTEETVPPTLDEIAREGARRMLMAALGVCAVERRGLLERSGWAPSGAARRRLVGARSLRHRKFTKRGLRR